MKRKDSVAKRAGDFFSGNGFYIVLLLCVAVIGVSAWAMLSRDVVRDSLDLPVIGEVEMEDRAQLPPSEPTFGETGRQPPVVRPTETPEMRPTPQPEEETFLYYDDEPAESVEQPSEAPTPPQTEAPAQAEPEELRFVWPVSGEVEVPHSLDELIFDRTMGDWRTHAGIDIRAELGETVLAITGGVVERIFHDDLLGTTVVISHGNGLQSLYANLMEQPTVEVGQWVSMGTPIGAVGGTALAKSGIVHHLHLEVFEDGARVDPMLFLPERHV